MAQTLQLQGECTIYSIAEQYGTVLDAYKQSSGQLTLDLSNVSNVDTTFVQLVAAFHQQAIKDNTTLTLSGVSDEVSMFFKRIHCQGLLDRLKEH